MLLLDEPAAGLDPEARRRLSELLVELRAGGMTLMVSSHILAELEDYCSEMLMLQDGQIVGAGPIEVAQPDQERLRIALAAPNASFADILSATAGVGLITADQTTAEVAFDGDPAAQHALLRELIDQGLAVCAMSRVRRRLEDAYFDRAGRAGGAADEPGTLT